MAGLTNQWQGNMFKVSGFWPIKISRLVATYIGIFSSTKDAASYCVDLSVQPWELAGGAAMYERN